MIPFFEIHEYDEYDEYNELAESIFNSTAAFLSPVWEQICQLFA